MVIYLLNVRLHTGNEFFCLVGVELKDTSHLDFHQLQNVLLRDFADELWIVRCQAFIDMLASGVHILGLFKFLVLIDAFFDEYLFQ